MTYTLRRKKLIGMQYSAQGHISEKMEMIRDLGVIMDQKMSYSTHVQKVWLHNMGLAFSRSKRASLGTYILEATRIMIAPFCTVN